MAYKRALDYDSEGFSFDSLNRKEKVAVAVLPSVPGKFKLSGCDGLGHPAKIQKGHFCSTT